MTRLSVLDLGGPDDSFALAQQADVLGYERYWLAEHLPQPDPLISVALIVGMTERIRVGTAGVLLHYRVPSALADSFRFLDGCFPGRIDAGVCGGRIGSPEIEAQHMAGRDPLAHFAAHSDRVAAFAAAARRDASAPELWSHGSSPRGAHLAARLGMRFGYTLFHQGSVDDPAAVEAYRRDFVASSDDADDRPYVALALAGVCAETDAAAHAIAAEHTNQFFQLRIVGSPSTCRAQIADFAARFGADEVVFADQCKRFEDRMTCYQLLAPADG